MKIFIADDHVMVRRGLKMLLSRLFDDVVVEDASNVAELIDRIDDDDPPDIVLLDLLMPGMNGTEGLEAVNKRLPGVPVAIISALDDADEIVDAIHHGARGFIPKSSDEKVLKLAISLILSGEVYIPSNVLKGQEWASFKKLRASGPQSFFDNPLNQLTKRERSVLRHLMLGQTNKEIARDLELIEGSVKKYTHMVFKKLKVSNRTKAVIRAIELGWVQADGDDRETRLPPKP